MNLFVCAVKKRILTHNNGLVYFTLSKFEPIVEYMLLTYGSELQFCISGLRPNVPGDPPKYLTRNRCCWLNVIRLVKGQHLPSGADS